MLSNVRNKVGQSCGKLEQQLFRRINAVVEPLVSLGVGSPVATPASLIVLESTGFKSGQARRTPLWSLQVGACRLISTARGDRSFWVKNLQQQPRVNFSLGGERRDSEAIVIAPGFNNLEHWELGGALSRLASILPALARRGWAFAILVPAEG